MDHAKPLLPKYISSNTATKADNYLKQGRIYYFRVVETFKKANKQIDVIISHTLLNRILSQITRKFAWQRLSSLLETFGKLPWYQ